MTTKSIHSHLETVKAPLSAVLISLLFLVPGCSTHAPPPAPAPRVITPRAVKEKELDRLGYTIQVGAFARMENAVRLSSELEKMGVNPYYFRHSSGLYKVRFGNFSTLDAARLQAEHFLTSNLISDYYLVRPQSYSAAREKEFGNGFLREKLVSTAREFLGIPYRFGGSSPEQGFDCSGLVMAVYRLNGLDLPRTAASQFKRGRKIGKDELRKGDLVFFDTRGLKRVSHVGIFTGSGNFIHAPRRGKKIQRSSLANSYFKSRYLGARTYLAES